jgi:TRAP-type uncharacterized transport system substrate-binding protein
MGFSSRRLARSYLREGIAASLFVIAAGVGLLIYFGDERSYSRQLVITGGSANGLRARIAHRLVAESRGQELRLRLVETDGSKDALSQVDKGSIDLALVQGGISPAAYPHVRQLATLHIEPLHLLVKPEIHRAVEENLASLRGKTVNLSTAGSGTHDLALDVLRFAGLSPQTPESPGDFQVSAASYRELEEQVNAATLPDAIFTVSNLPSPLVRHLIAKQHYKLVSLPFGDAFALESFEIDKRGNAGPASEDDVAKSRIFPTMIPAYTYGMEPPTPPAPLATFGPRLLLVAHQSVPPRVVRLLLEAVFSSGFSHFYRPPLDPSLLEASPEFPWHPGTDEYREHHKPLVAGDVIDILEKGTSLAGAIVGALFFLWQWLRQHVRRKRELGFETYMIKVAAIEEQALNLELGAMLDLKELLRLQVELNRLKHEALHRFADGKLEGEALMSGFIAHVNDARNHLTRLILHERDNLEERAEAQKRAPEELWVETMGEASVGNPGSAGDA